MIRNAVVYTNQLLLY